MSDKASLWSLRYKNTHLGHYIHKCLVMLLQCNYSTNYSYLPNTKDKHELEFITLGQKSVILVIIKKKYIPLSGPFKD